MLKIQAMLKRKQVTSLLNCGLTSAREVLSMAVLNTYNINAMATQISKEFYIEGDRGDQSHILIDEMRLFGVDMKSRVTFISRVKK